MFYRFLMILIAFSYAVNVSAVSLSANVNGYLNYEAAYIWGPWDVAAGETVEWVFTLKLEDDTSTTVRCPDGLTYSSKKFTVNGREATKYSGCLYYVALKNDTGSTLKNQKYTVVSYVNIKNNKNYEQKIRLRQFRNKQEVGANSIYTVPANSSCTAEINNLPIGTIRPGTSKSINLPFTITGAASSKSLVISGTDIQSDGKLNLGGSASGVKVYPASTYISGSKWNAGSSSGKMLLTIDTINAKAGLWSSNMLATLTCS